MSDTSGVAAAPYFFYANPTGEGLSYEQLKQRRAIAAALASRARPYPTTIGQGIASLGESFGDAMYERATQAAEREQSSLDRRAREAGGGGGAASPPPAASPSGRRSAIDEPNPVYASLADSILSQPGSSTSLAGSEPPAVPAPQPAAGGPAPMMTRMAALNTGPTASDAGSPGTTYGGPSPAGPGASTAEPPASSPPSPSVPPVAAALAQPPGSAGTPMPGAAGGGQVPRAALAGPVMAQAGTRPPVPAREPTRVTPPVTPAAPTISAAPGGIVQPPGAAGTGAPGTYLDPGQVQMNPPQHYGDRPPKPPVGQDTPEMTNLKRVLSAPEFRNISPPQREQLMQSYQRLKDTRDKQDSENLAEWNRLDADWLARKKDYEEKIRTLPQQRLELSEKTAAENIRRRFGSEENYKAALATTKASADSARSQADALHNLYKAEGILKNDPMVTGLHAQTGPGVPIPGLGHIGFPSNTYWHQLAGETGYFPDSKKMVENTQEYRATLRTMMRSMLSQTTGPGSISNIEVDQALEAIGLGNNAEKGAMLGILDNIRNGAIRKIQDHNGRLSNDWNVPAQDESLHRMHRIDVPTDPQDAAALHVSNTPQDRAAFDRKYGPGAAARELSRR